MQPACAVEVLGKPRRFSFLQAILIKVIRIILDKNIKRKLHKKNLENIKNMWYNKNRKRRTQKGGAQMQLSADAAQAAREARNAYQREYNARNKEKRNEYARAWRAANRDKVRAYNAAYWTRKAAKDNGENVTEERR